MSVFADILFDGSVAPASAVIAQTIPRDLTLRARLVRGYAAVK